MPYSARMSGKRCTATLLARSVPGLYNVTHQDDEGVCASLLADICVAPEMSMATILSMSMHEAQVGLITGLLDHTTEQLRQKPFTPGKFDETLG